MNPTENPTAPDQPNVEKGVNSNPPIYCRACGYSGELDTYPPSMSPTADICCPKCGSSDNQHNSDYTRSLMKAYTCKHVGTLVEHRLNETQPPLLKCTDCGSIGMDWAMRAESQPLLDKKDPVGTVTKITIARLFNLGNFEHEKYEIEVQIPDGQSASQAFTNLSAIIAELNPKFPDDAASIAEENSVRDEIDRARKMTPEEFDNAYSYFGLSQEEWIREKSELIAQKVCNRRTFERRRAKAIAGLDQLTVGVNIQPSTTHES